MASRARPEYIPWKKVAQAYDELVPSLVPSDKYCIHTIQHFGEISGKLLDIGCGAGVFLKMIREHYPELELYGADISPVCAKSPRSLAHMAIAPAEALPFADNTFDFITMSLVIEHCQDEMQALTEVLRCLKPGGRFFVSTNNRLWLQIMAVCNLFRREKNRYRRLDQIIDREYSDREFRRLLLRAGFTAIRREPSGPCPFLEWLLPSFPRIHVHVTKRLWYMCRRPRQAL